MTRAALLAVIAVCLGCGAGDAPKQRLTPLATCPSPAGRVTATLTLVQGGGAAGWEYNRVRVHQAGVPDDTGQVALSVEHRHVHAYWAEPTELVVEYPAALTPRRLVRELRVGGAAVRVTPHPVHDMELNTSDASTCYPYRDGWPQRGPESPGA